MKGKKLLSVVMSAALTLGLTSVKPLAPSVQAGSEVKAGGVEQYTPINRDSVVEKLTADGKLPVNASQDQINAALKSFVNGSQVKGSQTKYDKMRASIIENKVEEGLKAAETGGNKLGQGKTLDKATAVPYGEAKKTVKVLVLLGDFTDYKHNSIAKPDLTRTYWTGDFSKEHYQKLLFDDGYYTTPEGTKSPTFKQYFKEQSNGNLDVEGDVFGWYQVPNNAKYYGEDYNGSHNRRAKDFTKDMAKAAVEAGVKLSDYDIEDPYDLDKDKNLNEPDGIVDHLMVIYPGMGQEAGGGKLGIDAIWSHSSSVGNDPYVVPGSDMAIYRYTTEAENGAVGVFTHEFVHDLGMPDDYDTQYTADGDIVEYWSLMASGSWSGAPGGSMPSGINPYSRIMLGLVHGGNWINWEYKDYADIKSEKTKLDTATMNTGNKQAVLINLPEEKNILAVNKPAAGVKEFFGGTGSEIDNNMVVKVDLKGKTKASLAYDVWYDIEENWDAGFVQVSEDGTTWISLATPHTVADFDNEDGYTSILNSLPAYTGSSNGWLKENIDLSAYAGKEISIRFRYATDWGTELSGMFVDNILVTADGATLVSEGAENDFGSFTSNDFEISDGNKYGSHYYVAEWRSHLGVDEGLKYSARAKVEYNQGLALWYINNLYNDNWVGDHPGYGQLGLVDAGQFAYLNAGLGNGNENGLRTGYMPFVQMHDAAFSLNKAADMNLSIYSWALNPNLQAKQAEPLFDDSKSYFNAKSPYSGLKLPKLGLKIRVTGNAPDYSRGEVYLSK
jgi:immune inhibitor A